MTNEEWVEELKSIVLISGGIGLVNWFCFDMSEWTDYISMEYTPQEAFNDEMCEYYGV